MQSSTEKWLREETSPSVGKHTANASSFSLKGNFLRYSISDLIQQECCTSSVNYPVDKSSSLVKIECRKPGCRCVLKNEPALAFKVVSGITIIQAKWTRLKPSVAPPQSTKQGRRVILTSCSPAWFELLQTSDPHQQPLPVPIWSNTSSLCQACPQHILLRGDTVCLYPTDQSINQSSAELNSEEDAKSTTILDARNVAVLPEGTVLQVTGPRLCQLTPTGASSASTMWSQSGGSQRTKLTAMLHCSVVGSRALSDVASHSNSRFAFSFMSSSNSSCQTIYIPLDSKSHVCSSPVISTAMPTTRGRSTSSNHSLASPMCGLYNALTLLTRHRLPLLVKPVSGAFEPLEFLAPQNPSSTECGDFTSQHDLVLKFESCHHGDLIFLEPLSDCNGPTPQRGRFFVVTPDMLSQHYFFKATSVYNSQHVQQLDRHAHRVAHFLASVHPADGLTYLVKHLEDVSQIVNSGPSHLPVTRTLGPISCQVDYAALQSTLASCVASAALATRIDIGLIPDDDHELPQFHKHQRSSSSLSNRPGGASGGDSLTAYSSSSLLTAEADQTNALCDELDDIYYYVRNGRMPSASANTQSRSMISLMQPSQTGNDRLRPIAPPHLSPNFDRRRQPHNNQPPLSGAMISNSYQDLGWSKPPPLSKHRTSYDSGGDINNPLPPNTCSPTSPGRGSRSKARLFLNQLLQHTSSVDQSSAHRCKQQSYTNSRVINMCYQQQPPASVQPRRTHPPTTSSFTVLSPPPLPANTTGDETHIMQLVTCFDSCRVASNDRKLTSNAKPQYPPSSRFISRSNGQGSLASAPRKTSRLTTAQSTSNLNNTCTGRIDDCSSSSALFAATASKPPPDCHSMTTSLLVLNSNSHQQQQQQKSCIYPSSRAVGGIGPCRRKVGTAASNNSSPDTGLGPEDSIDLRHHQLPLLTQVPHLVAYAPRGY